MLSLLKVIEDSIRNDILAEVKQTKFYSVIADEVTDTANKEELSLSLHFVFDGRVKKVFVDFVEVERITGQVLGSGYPPVAVNTRSLQSRHQRSVLRWCVQYVRSSIRM